MSIAVKYNFTENTSAVLTYDDYDHNTTAPDNVFVRAPFSNWLWERCSRFGSRYWKTSPQGIPLTATLKGENTTLKVTHSADNYEIKYIMGIMDYEEAADEASWGTPAVFFPVDRDQDFKQTSHELQFISDYDGPMNFVAGLYSMEADSYITSGPVQNFTSDHSLEDFCCFW